jgi:sulfur carrier protein ThiS
MDMKNVLEHTLEGYTGDGWNARAYLSHDALQDIYMVLSVGIHEGHRVTDANLIVRVVGETIIIERDMNSDTLMDALLQAGIPRTQIIAAYAGEPVPDPA